MGLMAGEKNGIVKLAQLQCDIWFLLAKRSFAWFHLHKMLIWHVLDSFFFTSGTHPQLLFKSTERIDKNRRILLPTMHRYVRERVKFSFGAKQFLWYIVAYFWSSIKKCFWQHCIQQFDIVNYYIFNKHVMDYAWFALIDIRHSAQFIPVSVPLRPVEIENINIHKK